MEQSPGQTVSGAPLLATKRYAPRWRHGLVARPRLTARLEQGAARPLTLVSAPAGFGKTTLLAEWLASPSAGERAAAWVSLDKGDNDPAVFWAYVATALQAALAGAGGDALALLRSPQPSLIEAVLATLLNELAEAAEETVLVLDDYHAVQSRPIHEALAFLLDHLPPRVHLVIATREDPPLPLARLRARAQLTELRAADLRFTPDEAAAFLNEVMGLGLAAGDVAALETRTEGWIAGLQLAALSMQGREDVSGFIDAFAGDDRYIVDYLIEEVLQCQPERIRSFLLETSMLDRLSGPLCDAVTGQGGSSEMLQALERGNLFVVPLDDKRRWFRYHHLFADVLRAHALEEQPERVPINHRRASAWLERNGFRADAIRHALVAGDVERAADLVELAGPAMRRSRQEATLRGWLDALPEDLFRNRPVLSVEYAGTLLSCGELDGVDARLRDAERWLETTAPGMVVMDDEAFRRLPAAIFVYRAGRALAAGDLADTVTHARRALDLVAEDDLISRGAAAAILGLASWTRGDLAEAYRSYADGMASLRRAGNVTDAVGGSIALADIRITQGRLRDALSIYQRAVQLATEPGGSVLRGAADMEVGMAELHLERNELETAIQHLETSTRLGEHLGFPQHPYRWRVAMASVRAAQGDLDGALDLLGEAERRYVSDFYPNVRPIAALRARVWIAQGRLDEAHEWARERDLSAGDDLSYLREFEHITLARLLIARYRSERGPHCIDEAIGLLERLLAAAETGGRTGSAIEILALQALAHEARDGVARALLPLERALTLTEPEGYARLFIDEGPPMARLLSEARRRGIRPEYAGRLLGMFGAGATSGERRSSHAASRAAQPLLDPLSEREIEVLRHVAAGLSNQEIGERLFLALDTVKGHNRRIFAKLGVQRRTEATSRARELGLL